MSGNRSRALPHATWLDRGDLFARIPIVSLTDDADPLAHVSYGPAILVTRDCQLDKPVKGSTEARIQRLHFLPLLAADALGEEERVVLERSGDSLQPYEPLFLGEVPSYGEAYVLMSHVVQVASSYFAITLAAFNVGKLLPEFRAIAVRNDTRVGRLAPGTCELLEKKWSAYWLGVVEP